MKLCMGCMNQMEDQVMVCPHCGFNERELKQEAYYLTPGTVVGGKYIIGRALSYAGYTVTYIGMDAENNRRVLVKEYLPNDFSTRSEGDKEVTIYSGDAKEQFEEGLTTFLNEANRIQQLGKPQGIMQVYDCVAENDTGYVISEYLEGQTLAQMLEGGKKFSPQEAKEFICEILEGLRRVHPLDVVHCDIAPETILVTRTGEIKLLDFGATRYVTTANSKSLAIILKQGYAPEEQYRSQGVRGPWTDVYALGAVMYHMITGIVPIESVDRALVDELKAPSQLGVPMPKNMENALMNALNVYQKDRTPSAEVFYRELNSDEVKRIQVKKQKYETGRFPKWAKVLVAGVLCAVVAGGVVVVWKMRLGGKMEGGTDEIIAVSVVGKSEEEANEILSQLCDSSETKIHFEASEVIFDKDIKNSEILTQNPASGDKVKQVIKGTVRSSEKCMPQDILNVADSVETLVKELKFDNKPKIEASQEVDASDEKQTFGKLYAIVLRNGENLTLKSLEEKMEPITLSEIVSITYYTSPYIEEKELGNYVGKNIRDSKLSRYTEKDGEKVKVNPGEPPCNKKFYSFDMERGYIVNQTVPPGKSYNSLKYRDSLFDTVKEKISFNENDADELIKRLKESYGFKATKSGNGNKIVEITTSNKDGGRIFFKKENEITIYTEKEEETAEQQIEQPVKSKPKSQNSHPRPEIDKRTTME